jgi:uncharacterized alpha-E superfamily protein
MLKSTAAHLFWMARYIERVQNTTHVLNAYTNGTLLTVGDVEQLNRDHRGLLQLFALEVEYLKHHNTVDIQLVLPFMVQNAANFSSVYYSLYQARENARAARTVLTAESWEAINTTWLDFQQRMQHSVSQFDWVGLFDWLKSRLHLIQGVLFNTMPRDEPYTFILVGTSLERADNIARLLDIKYVQNIFVNITVQEQFATENFYRLAAVLHSAAAYEAYYKIYRDTIVPIHIVELLITRDDTPRSLLASIHVLLQNLQLLANHRSDETLEQVKLLEIQLTTTTVELIIQQGLHGYLTDFMSKIYQIADGINRDFLT